ncbi:WD40 repeat-like protein [Rhizoclosmatium globosum]|uniref:Dynein axonemal intermediate chain 4 n=1 Tax=Rhizoclosmatium globosum TaxID=329046 RepID=A0A1Y2BKT0_9FUNG|nr:WD40 repeat-like protein [Rhizoclosmatium globosum]|eukprot:ORY35217.1 WD40 repeat-like protein [Rhizoclosmatium globosum]
MDQSTTGLPKRGNAGGGRLVGIPWACNDSTSSKLKPLRSTFNPIEKRASVTHKHKLAAAAMMQSQRLPKQAFRFDSSNHVADILRLPNSSMAASHSTAVVSGTKSMAGVALAQSQPSNVTVLDEEGNDVTPGMDMMSAVKESVSDVLNELESMNMASWNSSNFGGRHSASANSRVNQDGKAEAVKGSSDSVDKRVNKIDPQDSHKILHIRLKETENIILLNLPSLAVCPDFLEEVAKVKEANANYTELCATKANNENFTDRGMQTINAPKKNKDVQASGPSFASSECQASQWDIYDAYNTNSGSIRPEEHLAFQRITYWDRRFFSQGSTSATTIANQRALSQMLAAGSGSITAIRSNYASTQIAQSMSIDGSESERYSTTGPGGMVGEGGESQTDSSEKDATLLATPQDLPPSARPKTKDSGEEGEDENDEEIIEDDEDEEESYGAHIPTLMHCGRIDVKLLEWPERIYRSAQPVTSVDFSKFTPNLLAAGFADGRIAIYDVRQKTDAAALDNSHIAGKHRDPVWELKWIEREHGMGDDQSKAESLVSISTDGRVCQWQIRKGFEHADLMVLKRVTKQAPESGTGAHSSREGSGSHGKALISRQAGGLCFDFNSKDRNIYILGTEDGHIHRCSVSYNEQYLQTQFGHTGPVYKVKWSPFLPNVFLSCSADWTVRLWDSEEESCAFKFQSANCVSNDGRLEVWDLKHSVLDPIVIHTVLDRQLTSLIFGSKSSCILIGDDSGSVTVFNLKKPASSSKRHEVPDVALTPEEQAAQLDSVLKNRNQMAKPSE